MREKLTKYYKDKSVSIRIIFWILIIWIIVIQFIWPKNPAKEWLNFAGEMMPITGQYAVNQERFDRELALTVINWGQFAMIHKREWLFFPYIEKELKKAWLPDDLKYLAVAESSLRDAVVSEAGAAGLWQFMPWTATSHWLIVNKTIDERFDYKKETQVAIAYLKNLYARFGDWNLVAAAYNMWENWLQRSIDAQSTDSYYNLWLNPETSRYVFRILAMKYLMEHRYSYFDSDFLWEKYSPMKTKEIEVSDIQDLSLRASQNGYSYYMIRKINPWILTNKLDGTYKIQILDFALLLPEIL